MPWSSLLLMLLPIRVLNNFLFLQEKEKKESLPPSAAARGMPWWALEWREVSNAACDTGAYAEVCSSVLIEFARTHARGAARLRDCFRVSVQIRAATPTGHAVFGPARLA